MQSRRPRLKRYLPRSLFGRAFLILVLPVLLLQGVVASVLVTRHYDSVTMQMSGAVAQELDDLVSAIEAAPNLDEAEALLSKVSRPLGIEFTLASAASGLPPGRPRGMWDFTGAVIEETLVDGVTRPLSLDLVSVPKTVRIRVLTAKGVLDAAVPRRQMNPANPHQLLVSTTLVAVGLVVVAVIFLRNQVRPIRELAAAAQAFGRGRPLAFRPSGAEEVRRAGHAFLEMRARLERQIQSRTTMLSGVSHDLRTPLTRMKLALAMMEETPDTAEINRGLTEMERMIESFLAFARGEAGEETQPVDLEALVEEVAEEAMRLGARLALQVEIDPAAAGPVPLRRATLKRALVNLVENARRYGGAARLTLRQTRRTAELVLEDAGPGIPADRREEMLRPFTRLDPARGQSAGSGTGLGLSIALEAARAHGGDLTLDESPSLSGLRATL
ncbi:MAG: ATP-binding protein, partial [Pseudomonadota bacterium]